MIFNKIIFTILLLAYVGLVLAAILQKELKILIKKSHFNFSLIMNKGINKLVNYSTNEKARFSKSIYDPLSSNY